MVGCTRPPRRSAWSPGRTGGNGLSRTRHREPTSDNGSQRDYLWLQVEDRWFPSGGDGVSFSLGQTKYPSSFGNPIAGFGSSGLEIRVVLDKFPGNVTVEREVIACDEVSDSTRTFSNGDAVYDLVFDVTD